MPGDPSSLASIGQAADSIENAQWWLVFAILVANKPADATAKKVEALLAPGPVGETPFELVRKLVCEGRLVDKLKEVRTGQYSRIAKALTYITDPFQTQDPRTLTVQTLMEIPGVGPKTATWYYMLINPKSQVAALDTHLLKFLRDQGIEGVPKSTPPNGPTYYRLSAEIVAWANKLGIQLRDFDFFVWAVYRAGGKVLLPRKEVAPAPVHHMHD